MKVEFYGYTDTGSRMENEDSYSYETYGEERYCAVVADGLGGHKGGREASRIAVRHLASAWENTSRLPAAERLLERLNAANSEILAARQSADQMKSTVVALYLWGKQAIWIHIGDSRLYHYHDGCLIHYTNDHSVPQISVQMGELTRSQIPGHPDRGRLLRVLGTEELRPEFSGPVPLGPGQHAFLLCSDGFWEYLREEEIGLDLGKSESPKQWIDYLRWRGNKRKSADADNNTAIAVFLEVET